MITGTCHFVSKRQALNYYRKQDSAVTFAEINDKVEEGAIIIGPPAILDRESLHVIDGRYHISRSEVNA